MTAELEVIFMQRCTRYPFKSQMQTERDVARLSTLHSGVGHIVVLINSPRSEKSNVKKRLDVYRLTQFKPKTLHI